MYRHCFPLVLIKRLIPLQPEVECQHYLMQYRSVYDKPLDENCLSCF